MFCDASCERRSGGSSLSKECRVGVNPFGISCLCNCLHMFIHEVVDRDVIGIAMMALNASTYVIATYLFPRLDWYGKAPVRSVCH